MPKAPRPPPSTEITPPELYARRREFIKAGALFVGTSSALGAGLVSLSSLGTADPPVKPPPLPKPAPGSPAWVVSKRGRYGTSEAQNSYEDITTYNNYYELGFSKTEPAGNGFRIKTKPWTLRVTGEVAHERTLDIDTLIAWFGLEERVYRMRCVEAWSMVIPWVGIPLAAVIKRADPTPKATFVEMQTVLRPAEMPGLGSGGLNWPYTEGLRMDEATNPLAFLAVGLYGKTLMNQNGAPIRLVVPWKYGFKGAKSIVRIRFVERQPLNTWQESAPQEYGFYSNVNPAVDHPRWSQSSERRIGEFLKRKTLMFNGYADQVQGLYAGMDLKKNY
jgi:sulfoxide reductase catalytic subunit YedY